MRNRHVFGRCKIPMNLQFFAEDDTGSGGTSGTGDGGTQPPLPSFDDFMKDAGNQTEFNKRVQDAIKTEKEKWKAMTDDKLSEAEKLAKMTKEEKAEYMRQKREKELTDREVAITRKELMAEAKNTLAEKKLPAGLAEVLNYADADSCKKSIELVEKAFQEAVAARVEEQLKGGKPPKKAPDTISFTREQVAAMSPDEVNKNWDNISKAMTTWGK